jgi:hypothetical protein
VQPGARHALDLLALRALTARGALLHARVDSQVIWTPSGRFLTTIAPSQADVPKAIPLAGP